ncbi:hypothetical protein WN944_006439 [Citrus x changshan-huyou]|uniref:NB-ARC domain-containing protein n=1 Tax=Citrus x changshan-huyou TaxID=2935761 RepID=A0AAP0MLU4_9ROSI
MASNSITSTLQHWLVNHPQILNFTWTENQTPASSLDFLILSILTYLSLTSILYHTLTSTSPSSSPLIGPHVLKPITAVHNLTLLLISLIMAVGCTLSIILHSPHLRYTLCFPPTISPSGPLFFYAYIFYLFQNTRIPRHPFDRFVKLHPAPQVPPRLPPCNCRRNAVFNASLLALFVNFYSKSYAKKKQGSIDTLEVNCKRLKPWEASLVKSSSPLVFQCKGVPLAAKVIGNLLRSKSAINDWQRILDSEMWKVEEIGKDYNMYKEELISLWMAQGYLNAEEYEEMEMTGEECFNISATRSFFQEFEKNDDDDIMSCKMHDIVHDFAQFVSSKECLWLEINSTKESVINSFGGKVRPLGLNFKGGTSFPMSIHGLNRLRTLLIDDESPSNSSLDSSILPELFSKLACLRALVIGQSFLLFRPDPNLIREIPKDVGKLMHLKYLHLSELHIERLPETLCELYNLQKLDIRGCRNIRELPAGIGKLKNMRSLLNGLTCSLKYMPIGITKLTNLQTLDKFAVGGGVDGGSTCRLECLKNLLGKNQDPRSRSATTTLVRSRSATTTPVRSRSVTTTLVRSRTVTNDLPGYNSDEAKRLELKNIENLLRLYLLFEVVDWEDKEEDEDEGGEDKGEDGGYEEEEGGEVVNGEDEERRRKNEKDEQLLEALQPPLNVEELWILLYGGNIFPKWFTLLTNLRNLFLRGCLNCEHLPPLGKLPLEKLALQNLNSVKRVGNEVLGIEESSDDDPSSSSSSSSVIAFPKLKSLKIWDMEELEEWDYRVTRKENISIMPRLSSLEIDCCPKLKVLKSLKAKHLWADHIFQLTKQFDVGTIMQVCRVSSSRVVRAFAVNLVVRAIAHSLDFRGKVFDACTMAVKRHIKFGTFWYGLLMLISTCMRKDKPVVFQFDPEIERTIRRLRREQRNSKTVSGMNNLQDEGNLNPYGSLQPANIQEE